MVVTEPPLVGAPPEEREVKMRPAVRRTTADRVFRGVVTATGAYCFLLILGVAVFLTKEGWPALHEAGFSFFTTQAWQFGGAVPSFGISGLLVGSILVAGVALTIAVPVSVATALFINEYAPARARRILTSLIDLLAAIPSLVFGLWGRSFLQGPLANVAQWLTDHASFIPYLRTDPGANLTSSNFVAGVVVGIMIIPIITSISREVMNQVPRDLCEAAYALGGTRAGMIRRVILPFGRSGIVGASMLGLGRALGETIAVAAIISGGLTISPRLLQSDPSGSVAAKIALSWGEAGPVERSALIASGLGLFLLTMGVNVAARFVVNRSTVRI